MGRGLSRPRRLQESRADRRRLTSTSDIATPRMDSRGLGAAALEALQDNDADAMKAAFKTADPNTMVRNGVFAGKKLSDFGQISYEEGDTMLHMALRNKKWPIREVMVCTLEADATVRNDAGMTPPGLQLQASAPRTAVALTGFALLHFEIFEMGDVGYYASLAFVFVSLVDLLLDPTRTPTNAQYEALEECFQRGSGTFERLNLLAHSFVAAVLLPVRPLALAAAVEGDLALAAGLVLEDAGSGWDRMFDVDAIQAVMRGPFHQGTVDAERRAAAEALHRRHLCLQRESERAAAHEAETM